MKYNQQTGWIEGIRHCASPNYDARPAGASIDLVVIHGISLPPEQYGSKHIDQLFTNKLNSEEHPYFKEICNLRVSTHLLIRRTGEVVQYVSLNDRAWHAGVSEFNGRTRCNDFSIGIELEGSDHEPYEIAQYNVLASITKLLQHTWPKITEEEIVGHCHIAPGRKTDPGLAFDWKCYRKLIEKR